MYALIALLLAANAPAPDNLKSRVSKAPKQVVAFIERRADCNHFLGEEPYDKEREAELNRTIRELRCDRIDRDEQTLRRAYAKNRVILSLLDETADMLGW